ncbi:MAG: hypothetical protein GWP08_17320 [Nitrospiraceae bacterium]|nr:hypothetical protein [Nitrospiraceae bacterium]
MADTDLQTRLRHAWSYYEKAQVAMHPEHTRRAQDAIEALKQEVAARADDLAGELRALLEAHADLDEQASGDTQEARHNLADRLAAVRQSIAVCNALASVQSAAGLGGPSHLSFEQYAALFPPSRKPHTIDLKPTPLGFILWLLAMAVVIVGILAYRGVILNGTGIALDAAQTGASTLRLTLHHSGAQPVTLSLSTSNGVPSGQYALSLYAREPGAETFRPIEVPPDCWRYQGDRLSGAQPIDIMPGTPLEVRLDLTRLAETTTLPDALRFVLSGSNGRPISTQEVTLTRNSAR